MHPHLRSFLDQLRAENDLVEIDAPVDPHLERAGIHGGVIAQEGTYLLVTRVKGGGFPVVIFMFGTACRVDLAFGPRPEQTMKKTVDLIHELLPHRPGLIWKERGWI